MTGLLEDELFNCGSAMPPSLERLFGKELLLTLQRNFGDLVSIEHVTRLEEIAKLPESQRLVEIERLVASFKSQPRVDSRTDINGQVTITKKVVF
ncbi:hypothetical protein BOO92_13690 [Vibrio navarrensis]|nr:hypothetical protein [Vibrio navarrensis]